MKYILVLLLFCVYATPARAQQNEIDKLEQKLGTLAQDTNRVLHYCVLAQHYLYVDVDKTVAYLDSAETLTTKLDYTKGLARIANVQAVLSTMKGDFQAAINYFEKSAELFSSIGDEIGVANANANIGSVYFQLADYPEALDNFVAANRIYKELDSKPDISISYANIGSVYLQQEHFQRAIEQYQLSIDLCVITKDSNMLSSNYANMGVAYTHMEEFEKSEDYLTRAEKICKKTGNLRRLGEVYDRFGELYFQEEEHEISLDYLRQALELWNELEFPLGIAMTHQKIGNNQLALENPKEATNHYLSALEIANGMGTKNIRLDAYRGLSESYAAAGNFKQAYNYQSLRYDLNDSIYSTTKHEQIARMEAKFKNEHLLREIAEKDAGEAKTKAESERTNFLLSLAVIGILSLGLLFLIFFVRNRIRRIRRETEFIRQKADLERKLLKAQMNPHFIYNSLANLQKMFLAGKVNEATDLIADFGRLMRRILEHTSLDRISLEAELHTVELYVQIENIRLDHKVELLIDCDDHLDASKIQVPPILLQPIIENSIWHGIVPTNQPGKIDVSCHLEGQNFLVISIRDYGVGTQGKIKNPLHDSKSLELIAKRIGPNGEFNFGDHEEGGTLTTLKIALARK